MKILEAHTSKKINCFIYTSRRIDRKYRRYRKYCSKKFTNGIPLLIKDVAEVRIGNATRYGAITYNDESEVAGAVVMMLKGDNSSRVIDEVKERIIQIRKTLPEGVELEPFLDSTKMVNSAIGTVTKNLLEGALIVILVLVFIFRKSQSRFYCCIRNSISTFIRHHLNEYF
jgi:Cu/Ag efflux pump CusA